MVNMEIVSINFPYYIVRSASNAVYAITEDDIIDETVKTYKIGDRFTSPMGSQCILAQVMPGKICLINLRNGNRYTEPQTVSFPNKISEEEFKKISGITIWTLVTN